MNESLTLPAPPLPKGGPLLASRKHTLILLGILGGLTLLGLLRARHPAEAGTPPTVAALMGTYAVAIGLQALWVRFVNGGLKREGRSLRELVGPTWAGPGTLAKDLAAAALACLVVLGVERAMGALLGGTQGRVEFLIPHGWLASSAWVLVSLSAGIGEEIVFRGYLQRQLRALTGSTGAAIALQAVAFGLPHVYQGLKPVLSITLVGAVLGLLAQARGDLKAGIVAHTALDVMAGLLG